MSRYSGVTTVVDDEGNIVFERELTIDETIEAILAAVPEDGAAEVADDDEPVMTLSSRAGFPDGIPVYVTKEPPTQKGKACCGLKQTRHRKSCSIDNRKPFTEPTFNVVKTLLDDRYGSPDEIAESKSLPVEEVRRVNLADDFKDYVSIA